MTLEEYQKIISKTAVFPRDIALFYCTMGLAGEAGEVSEKMKKLYRDKGGEVTPEFKEEMKKELGDVMWYVTALSKELGFSLSEVMEENYNKLILRRKTGTLHGDGDNREVQ